MNELMTSLLGRKCRSIGSQPIFADARAEDYFYTVVGAWLEPRLFSEGDPTVIGYKLMVAVVSARGGGSNVMPFLDLEFWV